MSAGLESILTSSISARLIHFPKVILTNYGYAQELCGLEPVPKASNGNE